MIKYFNKHDVVVYIKTKEKETESQDRGHKRDIRLLLVNLTYMILYKTFSQRRLNAAPESQLNGPCEHNKMGSDDGRVG